MCRIGRNILDIGIMVAINNMLHNVLTDVKKKKFIAICIIAIGTEIWILDLNLNLKTIPQVLIQSKSRSVKKK
jgi:hypothetical protein